MLIPRPQRMIHRPGHFTLDSKTAIRAGRGTELAAELLREYIAGTVRFRPRITTGGAITLALDSRLVGMGDEGYSLTVSPQAIVLRAARNAGLLNGIQSLRQLVLTSGGRRIPCADISDRPRFAWRGAMIDVARHFMPASFLRRLVDLLALHKLNVLHLHLTDDQGWRMPVRRYPALTEVGAWRPESMIGPAGSTTFDGRPHGGAYTRRELQDLVQYASERGVTIVPEIEMPGHAMAALAAYPELGNFPDREVGVWTRWGVSDAIFGVQEATLDFCREVLSEVMEIFPSPWIHIGGDECPTVEWELSPVARQRIAAEGLAGPSELRGWFLGQISRFLVLHGRQPVCWDDGDHSGSLPAEATVMAWRDAEHGVAAAERGHQVVMTPWRSTYLDYPQGARGEPAGQPGGIVTLEDVYRQEIQPSTWEPELAAAVIGTQGQLWTEFAATTEAVEYLAFPRLCALAENAWSGHWPDFAERLVQHETRLKELGVHYRANPRYDRT
ncbi:beta-N-acetylhexosaminidase [Kibdelosporangium philippinense]|uniref:beta-N-acetylhexosaminidase n=1 Tax=Kibdelosporangium philippinense TaxID=211113 RepID=A0ABS8ZMC8_9PSEU|nr:beta-N-acetylhexosaminidase [Kibdelosporangium philippinense]MCE7008914.1 beta-N-acetylhexosaminidase [Kibdelosporangium philippinense]